ncbi:MAG: helix-turn-helix transcriptional regulator [Clostridia bacterium]|nr:helix-turn-helix transcriptional regulator [Clostridia bacterium]
MAVSFGKQLRHMRKVKGFTQKELAEKLNVSASCIGMYEQDKRNPDGDILLKIASLLDVSTDFLLGLDSYDSVKSKEVLDVIDDLTTQLELQKGLMYNGTPMSQDDISKICEAIKIAGEVALRRSKEKE